MANDNQIQKEQIVSQQLQIHLCHSEVVATKNKLKDSQLALRRSEEDKAQLQETCTRLEGEKPNSIIECMAIDAIRFIAKKARLMIECIAIGYDRFMTGMAEALGTPRGLFFVFLASGMVLPFIEMLDFIRDVIWAIRQSFE